MISQKLGVIGVGNMGGSILEGLFAKKLISPRQVFVYDKIVEKAKDFAKQYSVQASDSNEGLVRQTEVVLLAVKPQDLADTASQFRNVLTPEHLLISILAGTPLAKIRQALLGSDPNIVRAMPNLGAKVGEAITAVTGSRAADVQLAEQIFSGCGKTVVLEEKYFDLVTAVSGSGPAYFFFLMELLMKEAVARGLTEAQARLLAVQTALGAGKLAAAAAESPEELRKRVTSKGGTTEAALKVLFNEKADESFRKAVRAAVERGRELSR